MGGRISTISRSCLIVIAILRMLALIALVQLAQTSGTGATGGRGRWLLQLESIADRAGSCVWGQGSGSGSSSDTDGNTMHDTREI